MKKEYLLGIDVGTTGIKVGIFSKKGQLESFTAIPHMILHPKSNYCEVSLTVQWNKLLQCLSTALQKAQVSPEQIKCLGITTLCPVFIALDDKGEPLHNGIAYSDRRSVTQAKQIYEIISRGDFFDITGNRAAPGVCSLSSMLWIKKNKPEIFGKANIFGHIGTFFLHKLTGNFAIDWTNASFTGIYNTKKNIWSKELCALFGIPIEKLPVIKEPTAIVGRITEKASKQTGLKEGMPVVAGAADSSCSALALGVTEDNQIFQTSGGSEVTTICSDTPRFDNRFSNRSHVIPGKWLFHGAMVSSGTSIRWVHDNIFYPENKYRKIREKDISSPGANGTIFLPYLSGERTPKWDPYAKGVFWGLSLENTRSDMIRAVLEGVAYGMREIMEIVEKDLHIQVDEIGIVGGGAKNELWNQIKADIIQKRIVKYQFHETALLGAALLGGIGVNIFNHYQDAVESVADLFSIKKIYIPNPKKFSEHYHRNYEIYQSLYEAIKDIH